MISYFHVSHLTYQFEAKEVGENLGYMVDDRGDAEKRRRSAVILKIDRR